MKAELEQNPDINILDKPDQAIMAAYLIKQFVKNLNLLSNKLPDEFRNIATTADAEKVKALKELIQQLSKADQDVLRDLVGFCHDVAEAQNKDQPTQGMDESNLAVVFAENICPVTDMTKALEQNNAAKNVTQFMIENFSKIFTNGK